MKSMIKRTLFSLSLLICLQLSIFAQGGRIYDTVDGLSSTFINQVYQDSKGYIWVATEQGLNKFDGIHFTLYHHDAEDATSLKNNYVRCIFEDNRENLFIGFYNGMMRYNRLTDSFVEIPIIRDDIQQRPHITYITQLANGEVWFTTAGQGLFKYDPVQGVAYSMVEVMEDIQVYFLNILFEDTDGSIWFGTEFNGIINYHPQTKTIRRYRKPEFPDLSVTGIIKTGSDELLIGTQKQGVVRYDYPTDTFIPVPFNGEYKPFSVFTLCQVGDEIWVGCDGEGIRRYDIQHKQLEEYNPDIAMFDYNHSRVHSVLEDRDKNIWIGICQKGVVFINHKHVHFDYMGRLSSYYNPIGYSCVRQILQDHQNHLWICNDNEGLFELDANGKQLRYLSTQSDGGYLPKKINSLFEDKDHQLWIGSTTQQVGILDRVSGKMRYKDDINIERVSAMAQDETGNMYYATFGSGMYRYDKQTGILQHFTAYKGDDASLRNEYLGNDWINALMIDSEGILWIAHYKGISCFNPQTGSFVNYGNSNILIPDCIGFVLMEDNDGDIWAGTGEGLYRFNKKSATSKRFSLKNGLPNNAICGICQDENGKIWVSTYRGISCVNPHEEKIVNYYTKDGLQSNEFFQGAYCQTNDGKVYFGGVNGITSFYPAEIVEKQSVKQVYITDFSIQQQSVNINTQSGGHPVTNSAICDARQFTLAHSDNTFTIAFTTMTFDDAHQIVYAYRMRGLDDTWINTDLGQNKVTYNNLLPGQYTFEIFAVNQMIDSPIRAVQIVVLPPWYQSWWAYLIYALLAVLFIWGVANFLWMKIRRRHDLIERKHADEIINAKLQFFINISHEIRTPMTLIMGPLEKLMKTDCNSDTAKNYQLIYRNAHRILNLVNQLMDIHKVDRGQMSVHFEETELVSFIEEVMQSFEYTAHKRQIQFLFHHSVDQQKAWIDIDHFDKILINIISNAFKYTPDEGEIEIVLTTGHDDGAIGVLKEYIEIDIQDTGIGIEKDQIERIFECFYRIDNQLTHQNSGTGIGLYLSQLLVKLHQGSIEAMNRTDRVGSRLVIRIPQGKLHVPFLSDISETALVVDKMKWVESEIVGIPVSAEKKEERIATRNKANLLIVEDDMDICDYLLHELSDDYRVKVCHNGREAYELILASRVDLIISDVMMPEMDGIELCGKIKGNMNINHLPIILLTAKTSVESKVEGMEVGADAYLVKPFSTEILKSTIDNLIQNRHLLKTKFSGAQEQSELVEKVNVRSRDEQLMERIMKVVNENLSNPGLNAEMLATHIGLSRVHVHRKMKELTNLSTRDFIKNIRLRQAAILLQEKKMGITDVAYATGFNTLSYFSALFKEVYGVTPKEYRESFSRVEEN